MAPKEILRQIESLNCPFVFRVADTAADHGFALTCWHNTDWSFVHAED